jgi:negative regulator of sigma-B (phosphoserine phosphatase)
MDAGAVTRDAPPAPRLVDWAIATRMHRGQVVSGDLHVVAPFAGGVLVAVVDGLGHGPDAAEAARVAAAVLQEAAGQPVTSLVERCHAALRRTRGAVLSVASFDARAGTMTWLGVGNVEGSLFRADGTRREALLLRGGVVGYQLPILRAAVLPIAPGDVLILATDGIRGDFTACVPVGRPPEQVADDIIGGHAKSDDDALVLVAGYLGVPS